MEKWICKERLTDRDVVTLIREGAEICKKLKEIHHEQNWWQISHVYTSFKINMRKFYSEMSEIELIKTLSKYSVQEIKDAFEIF